MRMRHGLFSTLRDNPSEAETVSHRLLIRAGFVRQLAAGVYTFLPLGLRVLRKIEAIIRDEMERAGASELLLPALHPAELWRQTGRWDKYGEELMRLSDRNGRSFALGATHEEVVTALVRDEVSSYKKLPLIVYQIQTKFRDERRPRFGLLRSREFVMKDAYSFDASVDGLDQSYAAMHRAYTNIFRRCGLTFRAVEADSGLIGGTDTHEFMALADIGEDTIAHCPSCGYAANLELAESAGANTRSDTGEMPASDPAGSTILTEASSNACPLPPDAQPSASAQSEQLPQLADTPDMRSVTELSELAQSERPLQLTDTPGMRSVAQLSLHLGVEAAQIGKAAALLADGQPVLALVRGDRSCNETKIARLLQAARIEWMDETQIAELLNAPAGFIGPVGLPDSVTIIADHELRNARDLVIGANRADCHYLHASPERDFRVDRYGDLRTAAEGDGCIRCGAPLQFDRGIEVGHLFKIGTAYSEPLRASYLDDTGAARPFVMGCYGIGVSRLLAAVIEQHHDGSGIVWPAALAPYKVHLIVVRPQDETQLRLADALYAQLAERGCEVLVDDRDDRPGAKFADADLIGLPVRITVGKRAAEGIVECSRRDATERFELGVEQVYHWIQEQAGSPAETRRNDR